MAEGRHKRDTDARRFTLRARLPFGTPGSALVAAPVAVVATAAAVTVGLAVSGGGDVVAAADAGRVAATSAGVAGTSAIGSGEARTVAATVPAPETLVEKRRVQISRSLGRRAAEPEKRVAQWTTTALNLWSAPGTGATQAGVVEQGTKVLATGRTVSGRAEVIVDGDRHWVTERYLADTKPKPEPPAPAGLSSAPCPDSGPENGLTAEAVRVYRSVCHAFPQITSYGGWDAHGEHSSGKAIDIMTSDVALGNAIAAYLQTHASELDLYDILWRQRIWTPVRAAEGWRPLSDRGSATANHYDHVHVSTNG